MLLITAFLQEELDRVYEIDVYGYLAMVVMMFQPGGELPFPKFEVENLTIGNVREIRRKL